MPENTRDTKIFEVIEKLRQVMVPLWHSSRASVLNIITKKYGINPAQFHTLKRINSGATSVSEVAECLHVSKPNISRSVDELVQKEFLTRERVENDRRKVLLKMTDKAEGVFKEMHKHHDQIFINQFRNLTDVELEELSKSLEILKRIIEKQDKESHA